VSKKKKQQKKDNMPSGKEKYNFPAVYNKHFFSVLDIISERKQVSTSSRKKQCQVMKLW
jgi:hypothetical protein